MRGRLCGSTRSLPLYGREAMVFNDVFPGVRRVLDATASHVSRTFRGPPPKARRAQASHGELVADAESDDTVTVTRNNRKLHVLSGAADALEFSPDGRLLAA